MFHVVPDCAGELSDTSDQLRPHLGLIQVANDSVEELTLRLMLLVQLGCHRVGLALCRQRRQLVFLVVKVLE